MRQYEQVSVVNILRSPLSWLTFTHMHAFDRLAAEPIFHGPVKQHYVSRFYLNGFSENAEKKRVVVYDRTNGSFQTLPPKKVATLEHFFTVIDESDRQRFELEALCGSIESRAGSALKALISKLPLSAEDREYVALFVAMHAIRTPAALEESLSVREKVERVRLKLLVPNIEAAYVLIKEKTPTDTPEIELRRLAGKLHEMVSGGYFSVHIPDEMARAASLKTWSNVAKTLFDRDWTIVHAPGDGTEYVTSDSPVVLSPLPNMEHLPMGYESPHAKVLFSLSRHAALVIDGSGGRLRHVNVKKEHVERFNLEIAADCFRYLIGSRADILQKTTEPLNLTGTIWVPRMDVGIGIPPGGELPAIWIKRLGTRPK